MYRKLPVAEKSWKSERKAARRKEEDEAEAGEAPESKESKDRNQVGYAVSFFFRP